MPLTTYTAGEVLTAASLNANLSFASTNGGLVLISSTTIGTAVSSVTVSGAFSSTYDNYEIKISGGVGSAGGALSLQLGATTTGYYKAGNQNSYAGLFNGFAAANAANWNNVGTHATNVLSGQIWLFDPNLAKPTKFISNYQFTGTTGDSAQQSGYLDNSTQYTAFTITPGTGTLTGGTIRVYGYANS